MRDPLTNVEIDLRKLKQQQKYPMILIYSFSQGEKEIYNRPLLYSQEKDKQEKPNSELLAGRETRFLSTIKSTSVKRAG